MALEPTQPAQPFVSASKQGVEAVELAPPPAAVTVPSAPLPRATAAPAPQPTPLVVPEARPAAPAAAPQPTPAVAAVQPAPSEPATVAAAPVEPAPVEPAPVEPAAVVPVPTEPAVVEAAPAVETTEPIVAEPLADVPAGETPATPPAPETEVAAATPPPEPASESPAVEAAAPAPEPSVSTAEDGVETLNTTVAEPPPLTGDRFLWPVQAGKIVLGYGPTTSGQHNDGVNIAAPTGTEVRAAENGVVAYAGNELRGFGNLLLIRHADGWMTAYAHNDALLVKRGDTVTRGQAVAKVGQSGSVGEPQLHFELRRGTRAIDPLPYLGEESTE
jgi:murein DD-endopeptidase MepM/ murein hydrolase activator NlpD